MSVEYLNAYKRKFICIYRNASAAKEARTRDVLSEFLDNPLWEAFKNKINNLADYLGGEG